MLVLDKLYNPANLRYDKSFTTMILGDSHAQHAFDPQYIDNSINLALGAEPYFYTYYKLRFLLDNNPVTKRVILTFSYLNLAPGQTKKLHEEGSQFTALFDRYFMLLDGNGVRRIRNLNGWFSPPVVINVLKYRLGFPINGFSREMKLLLRRLREGRLSIRALPFIGGFVATSEANVEDYIAAEMKKHRMAFEAHGGKTADLMVEYLKKIAVHCEERGVELILVNTPIHEAYSGAYPEETRASFLAVLDDVRGLCPHLVFLDYEHFELPDEMFQNGHHLNKYGAEVFSREINSALRQ